MLDNKEKKKLRRIKTFKINYNNFINLAKSNKFLKGMNDLQKSYFKIIPNLMLNKKKLTKKTNIQILKVS